MNFLNRFLTNFGCIAVLVSSVLLLNSKLGFAQRPSSSVEKLGVDEVQLQTNKRMYGIVLNRKRFADDGLTLLVERAWFERTYPAKYAKHLKSESDDAKNAAETLNKRLRAWKKERADNERVAEFVDAELEYFAEVEAERKKAAKEIAEIQAAKEKNRKAGPADQANKDEANKVKANPNLVADDNPEEIPVAKKPTKFAIVKYTAQQVKNVYLQPAQNRNLAGLAWKHDVPRVTIRNIKALRRELLKKKVDISNESFDFTKDVPTMATQSKQEWAARVAILEYGLLDKPMKFQGTGSMLIRIDPDNPPKAQDLMKMMGGGMGGFGGMAGDLGKIKGLLGDGGALGGGFGSGDIADLLKELKLDGGKGAAEDVLETEWWKSATDTAEKEGVRGIRITRVVQNPSKPVAKVEDYFFAMVSPGVWKPVISVSSTANRNEVVQADVERLKQDPRIQGALKMVEQLGIGGGNIEAALRQGAATEMAMNDSYTEFLEILDTYSQGSDGPPIVIE
ncbi:MAG: hypothetical protein AB8B55_21310 [Mariniblastus sp.]